MYWIGNKLRSGKVMSNEQKKKKERKVDSWTKNLDQMFAGYL